MPSWGPTWRSLIPHPTSGWPGFLNGLGHALIIRIDQVLRARDRVHVELKLPPENDSADEFLFALDVLLVCLDSCFDILGRVLNGAHSLGADSAARWRDERWVRKLVGAAPGLTAATSKGSALSDATLLIGALRRSLHGVPLQTVAQSGSFSMRDIDNLLVVPPDQQSTVSDVLTRRGGEPAWGSRAGLDGLLFIGPITFVEALTRFALEGIEEVVSAAIGVDAVFDPREEWGATEEVRHQLRALSGTSDWKHAPVTPPQQLHNNS